MEPTTSRFHAGSFAILLDFQEVIRILVRLVQMHLKLCLMRPLRQYLFGSFLKRRTLVGHRYQDMFPSYVTISQGEYCTLLRIFGRDITFFTILVRPSKRKQILFGVRCRCVVVITC